jgi:hypothetical protein
MKLSKTGKIARFYAWNYGVGKTYGWETKEFPKSFCPFFWALVFAVLFIPFTGWSLLRDKIFTQSNDASNMFGLRVITGIISYLTLILLGVLGWYIYVYPREFITAVSWILGLMATIVVATGTLYYFFWRSWAWEMVTEAGSELIVEAFTIAATKKASIKQNYCPKIDWE